MMILDVSLVAALVILAGAEPKGDLAAKFEAARRADLADRPVEAEAILKGAVDEESDPLRRAEALQTLAGFYMSKRRKLYENAEPLLLKAREIRERVQGPDSPDLASVLFDLGTLDMVSHEKEAERAEGLLRRALAIWEKAPRPEDRARVAKALHALGLFYLAKKEPVEAETMLDRALEIREKALGPEDPLVADVLDDLGDLHLAQISLFPPEGPGGHGELADRFYRRALKIREKSLGADHPDVADSYYNIIQLAMVTDRIASAEQEGIRFLAIHDKAKLPNAEKAAKVWLMIAAAAIERKDYAEADRRLEKTQALLDRTQTSEAASLYSIRASNACEAGNYDDAERFLREGLTRLARVLGRENSDLIAAEALTRDSYKLHLDDAQAPRLWKRARDFSPATKEAETFDLDGLVTAYGLLLRRSNRVVPRPTAEDFKVLKKARALSPLDEDAEDLATVTTITLGGLSDADLPHLAGLVELEELNLSGRVLGDADLAALRGLINLKRLHLRGTAITSVGMASLKDMTTLEEVDLSETKVTDAGLIHFKRATQLKSLDLSRTSVTDAGLERLADLPNLQSLNLAQTRTTAEGVARLRKLRPELSVEVTELESPEPAPLPDALSPSLPPPVAPVAPPLPPAFGPPPQPDVP